ncbi:hypothetical protein Taro_024264 [Colocasia esculenta]|uniref:CCHC-type domain-containing protein n=1 Tax=Colocasia esculenta TaxID=4460 RepID=A0A843V6Z0_COLES|nr:hypothetical protein [Colocasia esculenta]
MSAACRRLGAQVDVSELGKLYLLGQGVLLWELWANWLVRARFDEFLPRGRYVERREPRTGFVRRVLREDSMCRNTLKNENGLKPQVLMSFGVVRIEDPGLGFAPAKASALGDATMSRPCDPPHSEGDPSCLHNRNRRMKAKHFLNSLKPQYITQLAPLDIQTNVEMVKKAQLLEDATDFTDRIKGKFVKKEMTSSLSSAKSTNGKKCPFNITEGPSQERKLKAIVPNTPVKSNCKHCDKLGHMADECWRKFGKSDSDVTHTNGTGPE